MAKHDIECEIPRATVYNIDVVHKVMSDGKKLGELKVSRGNIQWTPSGHSVNHYTIAWEKFAELIKEHGKKKYTGKL